MILSTFVSDLILSLVSFLMAYRLRSITSASGRAGMYALAIIGVSAGLGSIHFLGISTLDPIYRFFIGLATYVAIPLFGVSFFHSGIRPLNEPIFHLTILALLVTYIVFGYFISLPILPVILGGVSLSIIVFVSIKKIRRQRWMDLYGLAGVGLIVAADQIIGTKGERGAFLNVDLFHYALAIANICLGISIRRFKLR